MRILPTHCWERKGTYKKIYSDAYLGKVAERCKLMDHPDGIRHQVQDVVASRDSALVRQEMDRALGWQEPSPAQERAFLRKYESITKAGAAAWFQHGEAGVTQFLKEVQQFFSSGRKRGGRPMLRNYIDLMAYEAKVAFYLCYSNAWVDLIPWLKEHRGLDELSERFLRFWHYQNQPVELPPGRTPSGLLLPAHVRVPFAANAPILLELEDAVPQALRPVLCGQVLGLHPLSQFFMVDATLRSIAGKYFSSDEPDRVQRSGRSNDCPLYWDLVGAILEAALRYRCAQDKQEANRRPRSRGLPTAEFAIEPDPMISESQAFDDWAREGGLKCANCHSDLQYAEWKPRKEGETVTVTYICRKCGRAANYVLSRGELATWLKAA
jgi:hypothetical protein